MTARAAKAAAPAETPDAAPPIAARGEIALVLDGVGYTLTPSFAAIGEIETATGQSLYQLAVAAEQLQLSLADAGTIAAACIRAHARASAGDTNALVKAPRIAELIYAAEGGLLAAVRLKLGPLLKLALQGEYDASGKLKLT